MTNQIWNNCSFLFFVYYSQVFHSRKEDTSFKTFPLGRKISVKSSSSNRTFFILIRKSTFNLLLTTWITLMQLTYTRPLHLGLKASTILSLPPVSLELAGMITPQIASQQSTGSPIKVHPPGEWRDKKYSLDGGLGLAAKLSLFQT